MFQVTELCEEILVIVMMIIVHYVNEPQDGNSMIFQLAES